MWHAYPYTDAHELNLDWILTQIKSINTTLSNFIVMNTIKYADPFQWNITTQYESNTIVMEPNTGTAYISVQPVPAGISITNTDFWTPVFDLSQLFGNFNDNITFHNEYLNIVSTHVYATGDWLIWKNDLYLVTQAISLGDALNPGTNIERKSVEELVTDITDTITNNLNALAAVVGDASSGLVKEVDDLQTVVGDNTAGLVKDVSDLQTVVGDNTSGLVKDVSDIVTRLDNADIINIADYPRLPGEADDTARIRRAIADCGGTNDITLLWDDMTPCKPLYFPAGTYEISENITVNVNNFSMIGAGQYNTIIKLRSDVRLIDSMFTFTEAYALTIEKLMIDGGISYDSVSSSYGADCGIWLDQCAYVTMKDVVISCMREQSMRCCHVWESYFENISSLYSGAYGDTNVGSLHYGTAILFSELCKISSFFPGAESNEIVFNKLAVSGYYGGAVTITNLAPVQNIYFNDVIEENGLFNWLGSPLTVMSNPSWFIGGADTYFTINGIYVYEHHKSFSSKRDIFSIQMTRNCEIKNATVCVAYAGAGTYTPYRYIVYNTGLGSVDVDLMVLESGADKEFDYIMYNNSQYGVTNMSQGKIKYNNSTSYYNIPDTDIFNDATRFFGTVYVRTSTGDAIRAIGFT